MSQRILIIFKSGTSTSGLHRILQMCHFILNAPLKTLHQNLSVFAQIPDSLNYSGHQEQKAPHQEHGCKSVVCISRGSGHL